MRAIAPAKPLIYSFGGMDGTGSREISGATTVPTRLVKIRAAKAEILPFERGWLDTNGAAIHEHSTCRMGADPKRSALTGFCQMHEVKNVFVVDGSAFTTATEKNSTASGDGCKSLFDFSAAAKTGSRKLLTSTWSPRQGH